MPGHEKFVKQMVSGAGGVDLAFLVIAADESIMPQTVEHLEILDSLGVKSGVVVISKIDMANEDFVAIASEEAMELVEGTFLEGKPIVPVSAQQGTGLDELKAALKAEALALPARAEEGAFRLPVDRVFTLPGAGVVVTGTCWGGAVQVGDKLEVLPGHAPVRVREVQVHGRKALRGASGQRLALALHGIKRDDIQRGFQIAAAGAAQSTRRLDVRVNVMTHYQGVIRNRQRLHIHHAGREVLGRIVLLDEWELGGEGGPRTGLAQLHLEDELVAMRDDRLVLRFYSPVTSLAGGVVLDPQPGRHKRFEDGALERLDVLESGDPAELFRQDLKAAGYAGLAAGEAPDRQDDPSAVLIGKRLYHRELVGDLTGKIADLVSDYAGKFPLRTGIPKEEARRKCRFKGGANEWNQIVTALQEGAPWAVVGDRIGPADQGPELSGKMAGALAEAVSELEAFGLDWPGLDNWAADSAVFRAAAGDPALREFKPAEVQRHLVEHGYAVSINNEYIVAADAWRRLLEKLRGHFAAEPEMAFATFREVSGLTRKLGIPMLEYLDQTGVTVRQGDVRVAGPSLEDG
jgi:selenocysteine-specific elongation factor